MVSFQLRAHTLRPLSKASQSASNTQLSRVHARLDRVVVLTSKPADSRNCRHVQVMVMRVDAGSFSVMSKCCSHRAPKVQSVAGSRMSPPSRKDR